MIAYHAADVDLEDAKGHARFARLASAGPWVYAAHPTGGTWAFWKRDGGGVPRPEDFGTPRPTADGLTYYPPKPGPVMVESLPAADRPDCVDVQLACGVSAKILPAYLAPRKILADGTIGDHITEYGKLAWRVRDLDVEARAANPDSGVALGHPDVLALCRAALRTTLRLTDELIDDANLFTTGDVVPLIEAAWHAPKAPAVGA